MQKNMIVRAMVSGAAALGVLSVTISAFARPPYVAVLKSVHPKTEVACLSCHDGAPPKLAKYGMAIQEQLKAAKTKTLTAAMIKAAEKKSKLTPNPVKSE
jgi:hypothetical protein